MSIQTIKQNFLNKLNVLALQTKRIVRRIIMLCVVTGVIVAALAVYMTSVAIPHAHNIYSAAKLIDGESRGESYKGQKAVFATILTRISSPDFPQTLHDVVYQPYSNNAAILQYNAMGDTLHEDLSSELGQTILLRTVGWYIQNELGIFRAPKEALNAHSYCTPAACEKQKGYFGSQKLTGQVGNHMFFGGITSVEEKNTFAPKTSLRPVPRPVRVQDQMLAKI